jgi:hypothetical protein
MKYFLKKKPKRKKNYKDLERISIKEIKEKRVLFFFFVVKSALSCFKFSKLIK